MNNNQISTEESIKKNMLKEAERSQNTRDSFLTFTFSIVFISLAFLYTNNLAMSNSNLLLYVIPNFIILPFTARRCYYRRTNAYYIAYLQEFYTEYALQYDRIHKNPENRGIIQDHIIDFLVNHETCFLSLICSLIFYSRFPPYTLIINRHIDYLIYSLPFIFTLLDFYLIKSVYNYGKMKDKYAIVWKSIKQECSKDKTCL